MSGEDASVIYFVGLIVISLVIGFMFTMPFGWMTMGIGLIILAMFGYLHGPK